MPRTRTPPPRRFMNLYRPIIMPMPDESINPTSLKSNTTTFASVFRTVASIVFRIRSAMQ